MPGKIDSLKEIEITIKNSDVFPQGGLAHIVCTLSRWGMSIKAERGDNKIGSEKLERYLNSRLQECVDNASISDFDTYNARVCSCSFINIIFGTNFMYYPTERQEAEIEHSIFGTVNIKDLHLSLKKEGKRKKY